MLYHVFGASVPKLRKLIKTTVRANSSPCVSKNEKEHSPAFLNQDWTNIFFCVFSNTVDIFDEISVTDRNHYVAKCPGYKDVIGTPGNFATKGELDAVKDHLKREPKRKMSMSA